METLSSPWVIGFLFLSGVTLVWLEFFLPGGVLGICGGILLVAGVAAVYFTYGPLWGSVSALGCLIVVGGFLAHWMTHFRSTFFGKRMLNANAVGDDEFIESIPSLVGERGVTTTPLRPSGKALIHEQKFDVTSQFGVVEKDTEIIVVKVDGISIVVQPAGSTS